MFKLEIETGNAAFYSQPSLARPDTGNTYEPGPELSRILRAVADMLDTSIVSEVGEAVLRDINGNRVGTWNLDTD